MADAAKNIWKLAYNWSKNGTIQRIFEELQKQKIINIQSDDLSLDSTRVKIHPDAAGAKKSSGKQNLIQKLEI